VDCDGGRLRLHPYRMRALFVLSAVCSFLVLVAPTAGASSAQWKVVASNTGTVGYIKVFFGSRGPNHYPGTRFIAGISLKGLRLAVRMSGGVSAAGGATNVIQLGCSGPPLYHGPASSYDYAPTAAGLYRIALPRGFPAAPGFPHPYEQCYLSAEVRGSLSNGTFSTVTVQLLMSHG